MKAIERICSTLKSGFGMTSEKLKELLFGFGKVYVATVAFFLAGFIVAILAAYVLLLISEPLALLGLLLLILVMVIGGGIALTSNTLMDNIANNKKFEFIQTAKKDWVRNSVYVVVMAVLGMIVSIPRIIGQFVEGITGLFLLAIGFLIYLAWIFIIQFAYWEYVVNRKGIVESIKNSYSAVMTNLAFVFGLDIIVGILMTIVAAIFYIIMIAILAVLVMAFMGGATVAPGANISDLLPLFGTGILFGALVFAVLIIIMWLTMDTLFKPICYCAWKEATKKKK